MGQGLFFTRFLDHTRHTTVDRTLLDEWSTPRTDLYLKAHNTHNRQTSMSQVGLEPTISAGERPQTARPPGPAADSLIFAFLQLYSGTTTNFVRLTIKYRLYKSHIQLLYTFGSNHTVVRSTVLRSAVVVSYCQQRRLLSAELQLQCWQSALQLGHLKLIKM